MERKERCMRISLALDRDTYEAVHKLSIKRGIPKSTVLYSIIYQNKDIRRELGKAQDDGYFKD